MINEEIKSIALKCTFLHKDIYEITEDGEVIGYLKQTENNNPPRVSFNIRWERCW